MPELPFDGVVTNTLDHAGQQISLRYAHTRPTLEDVQIMVATLRRLADSMEQDIRRAIERNRDTAGE